MVRRIAAFYGLALAVSWLIWAPWVLSVQTPLRIPWSGYLHLAGSLGPALAALVILFRTEGRAGLRGLARATFTARAARQAAVWAVVLPTVAFIIAALILGRASDKAILWSHIGVVREYRALSPALYALASLVCYGFGEEIGWRGFLYPQLRRSVRPLVASLLVVPFWALWHLPLFFASDGFRTMGIAGAAGWLVSLVSGSLLTSWLTDRARGSILPAAVLHAVLDIYFLADVGVPTQAALGAIVTTAGVVAAARMVRLAR